MDTQIPVISSEKRARFVVTFIVIVTALVVVNNTLGYVYAYVPALSQYSGLVREDLLDIYYTVIGLIGSAAGLMFIASSVSFIMWFWKAYGNLEKLGCWTLSARGWTIGCWFIPLANLYLPYMYMREMFDGVNDLLRDKNELNMKWASSRQVLIWWILFVCVFLFNQFSRQLDVFLFHNHGAYLVYLVTNIILWITSGILAVRMIRSYVAAEKELMTKPDNDDNLNL